MLLVTNGAGRRRAAAAVEAAVRIGFAPGGDRQRRLLRGLGAGTGRGGRGGGRIKRLAAPKRTGRAPASGGGRFCDEAG